MDKLDRLKDFSSLKITLASHEQIMKWSHGEVTKPETINYRTYRPEKDGLFDEKIFGPSKDYECYCGKYKRIRYKGVICDKCGVEVTTRRVRRERMGHIKLATACAHPWYFKGIPSKMGLLLDIAPKALESVIYFNKYIVMNVDYAKKATIVATLEREYQAKMDQLKADHQEKIALASKLKGEIEADTADSKNKLEKDSKLQKGRQEIARTNEWFTKESINLDTLYLKKIDRLETMVEKLIITEEEYFSLAELTEDFAKIEMGAEAIMELLKNLDLQELSTELKASLITSSGQKKIKSLKRLAIVESFLHSKVKPENMIMRTVPVIPPDLRPMVQLEGGRFATSDLNDLYRAVINRNNRLARLLEMGAPSVIVHNEKRMLQQSVDALIDSSKDSKTKMFRSKNKQLRSLSDMLKGKQGRFRQNLLGKRVDYSGRSTIVSGPELRLWEVGVPKNMALELFKPFVIRELMLGGFAPNPKSARYVLERKGKEVWDALDKVTEGYPVLINRAPTLHRLSILAFIPKLIEGSAIRMHPCVCAGFNADFDGDTVAIHLPLSEQAKQEAMDRMLSIQNILKPSDGLPIAVPAKEQLLGIYFMTSVDPKSEKYTKAFSSYEEARMAMEHGFIALRQEIDVLVGEEVITTTVGRLIFNQILPERFGMINHAMDKKSVIMLVSQCIELETLEATVDLIDNIKSLGFLYATQSGVSISIKDCVISDERKVILASAEDKAREADSNYQMGLITRAEKKAITQKVWDEATNTVAKVTWEELNDFNPVKMIVSAGAGRGSKDNVKQLGGMKGLVYDATGKIAEMPVKGNFRLGLSALEYFTGTRAARKSLADTALKTAEAGYLTRRLVDVAQDMIIREEDCGTTNGHKIVRGTSDNSQFRDKVYGRILSADLKVDSKTSLKSGDMITKSLADLISMSDIKELNVYSPLSCEAELGICGKCYGMDLGTHKHVEIGTPVGVLAAQSVGEPGTQLTMNTFHSGGIIGKDITKGLPRVEQLFESRSPKFKAVLADHNGKVSITAGENEQVIITVKGKKEIEYEIPKNYEVLVSEGQEVLAGEVLTEGHADLKELLLIAGVEACQDYIIAGIQDVFTGQSVNISSKHLEVIVRQMFNKVVIEEVNESEYFLGDIVSRPDFEANLAKMKKLGLKPAVASDIVLGITRAALKTDSFLSAASFVETTRVLTDASIYGKVDRLLGLKENVMIGRLIPVGPRAKIK